MAPSASEESFRTLFEPHRRAITAHCYRLLGSLQDAEEMVQETLLRAWQRQAELRSPSATRSWLYKIATNACLDLLKIRCRRALPHLVGPSASAAPRPAAAAADELTWIEPAPDTLLDIADDALHRPDARVSLRESIGLAFVTALQFLSPRQRAALLLVDVLGWRPEETAALLETTVFSVNSLLQRARKTLDTRRDADVPSEIPSLDDATVVRRYIDLWENGDLEAFTALLAEDARLSMPPQPLWFEGREAVRRFFAKIMAGTPRQYRFVPIRANGQAAVAVYGRSALENAPYEAAGITLLTVRNGRVSDITRFRSTKLFPLFGLPLSLPESDVDAG